MSGLARQFWLTVVPVLVGFSAVGLLVLAAFFPDQLFAVGSRGYIATAAVALVSLSLVVWRLAVGARSGPDEMERLGD
ncbi:hypothetical protein [Haloarcula litorea]|uniref:hypothetical protein n=1 Tax=Haloarcula litorea TaxID=3032579 RepID=UPI0023E83DE6|nr:hypothetical protein [Halomicroarcula sp. GDY20]